MSTSLLYHAFGIRGYKYSRTRYDHGKVIFTILQEPETYRCSNQLELARQCIAATKDRTQPDWELMLARYNP